MNSGGAGRQPKQEQNGLRSIFMAADPIEAKRLKEAYFESNLKIYEELVTKGFNLFTINMQLQAGLVDSE